MIRVILAGSSGKMGRAVTNLAAARDDLKIVAGIDKNTAKQTYPVFERPVDCNVEADVLIDFSHPSMFNDLLDFCVKKKLPSIFCTTGLTDADHARLKEAAKKTAVFFSANMSPGVFLFNKIARLCAQGLGEEFDIEITERHHNQKVDAPSGTALAILNSVKQARPDAYPVWERHSVSQKRDKNEIGMHALRGGNIVGTHEVLYAGPNELFEIRHTALSKDIFASGALAAAVFMSKQGAGFYNMENLVNAQLSGIGE